MSVIKPWVYGVAASAAMLTSYFLILTLLNSFGHAVAQFISLWPFMTLLIAGFGIQTGLFFYFREQVRISALSAASSGTISTGSMIACCAHHVSDVFPLLGLSYLAVFADRYQMFFITLGILSNALGVMFMLRMMQRHKVKFGKNSLFRKLMKHDMDKAFKFFAVAGAALLLALFIVSA